MRPRSLSVEDNRIGFSRRNRRGYGLIELAIAVFLLTVSLGVMVKAVTWVGIERRAADRRIIALQYVSNVLERLAMEPYDATTSEKAKAFAAGSPPLNGLPGASWEFEVVEVKDIPVAGKRITARLRWNDRSAGWDGPVALSCWVYPRRKS